jgi:hypothetical protein
MISFCLRSSVTSPAYAATSASALPLLRALVQPGERVERLGVLGLVLDDLVPELDADLGLLDALGGEPSRSRGTSRAGVPSGSADASRFMRPMSFSQSRRFS